MLSIFFLACLTSDKDDLLDTAQPTSAPTTEASSQPTAEPSNQPATEPSNQPAAEPSNQPAAEPSNQPTAEPTSEPSNQPTSEPTSEPTAEPTSEPLPSYTGNYNVNPCNATTTGYGIGQTAGDFALTDQNGETLYLSDFCGNAVLLVAAAFW